MSTYFYDNAFVEKLKKWTVGTEVTIVSPDETKRLFEVVADKNNDSPIKLPMICLRRRGGYKILSPYKKPLSFSALTKEANEKKSILLNAIPISIPYQLDIYTRYNQEADEYTRNLIFNIVNYPKLYINIPYNGLNMKHESNITISSDVEDNSSIPERLIYGQFTRMSIGIDIDDAYLFDVRKRTNLSIGFQVCVEDEVIYSENINPETDTFPSDD